MNYARRAAGVLVGCLIVWGAAGCGRTGLGPLPTLSATFDVTTDIAADVEVDAGDIEVPDVSPDIAELDVPPELDVEDILPDIPVPVVCGDGIVAGDEECDEGELNSELPDACRPDCTLPVCGDGVLDEGEECDDANAEDFDECSQCRLSAGQCISCESDVDCGRVIDRCASVLEGRACLLGCRDDADCPENSACGPSPGLAGTVCVPEFNTCEGCLDRDSDGYGIGLECLGPDCNDANAQINPGVAEICDDIDNNCNTRNDEGCPPDLLVRNGEEVTISDSDGLYDRVQVFRGGRLIVEPYDGEPARPAPGSETGCLRLNARIIVVEAGGIIDGIAAGGAGRGIAANTGFGQGLVNTGPGGGGYGGFGGSGPDTRAGGQPYGTADGTDIDQGSNGGGFFIAEAGIGDACNQLVGIETDGGIGGGCIEFTSSTSITIAGEIRMDGSPGQNAVDGSTPGPVDAGGGGSGGGVLLRANAINVAASGVITANGGAGGRGGTYRIGAGQSEQCIGNGGGGGAGGRIKLFAGTINAQGQIAATGGAGGNGPQANGSGGQRGSVLGP
jgi:cysteine-rich repeat protein